MHTFPLAFFLFLSHAQSQVFFISSHFSSQPLAHRILLPLVSASYGSQPYVLVFCTLPKGKFFPLFLSPPMQLHSQVIQLLALPLLFQGMALSRGLCKGIHLTLQMTERDTGISDGDSQSLKQVSCAVGTSSLKVVRISIHPFWSYQIPSNSDIL